MTHRKKGRLYDGAHYTQTKHRHGRGHVHRHQTTAHQPYRPPRKGRRVAPWWDFRL